MKAKKFSIGLAIVLILVLVGVIPASAQAERISYTGRTCPTYVGPPERQWISEDNVLHMRGMYTFNTFVSTTLYLSGTSVIIMNQDVDLNTGNVHAYGSVEIYPGEIDGTWAGRFSTHLAGSVVDGLVIVQGTGELKGMSVFNQVSADVPDPLCNNINTLSSGEILIH